jgi:hypothetical protein
MGVNDIFEKPCIDKYALDKIIHYVTINIKWVTDNITDSNADDDKYRNIFKINSSFIYYIRHKMSNNFILFGYYL